MRASAQLYESPAISPELRTRMTPGPSHLDPGTARPSKANERHGTAAAPLA